MDASGAVSDDELAGIIAVNERLGISKHGAIFGNGHYFSLTPVRLAISRYAFVLNVVFTHLIRIGRKLLSRLTLKWPLTSQKQS